MKTLARLVLVLGLAALAIVVGFCAAWGFIAIANGILPPFRPEDDDTLRERIPVGLAYLVWAAVSVATFVLTWRRLSPGGEGRRP